MDILFFMWHSVRENIPPTVQEKGHSMYCIDSNNENEPRDSVLY